MQNKSPRIIFLNQMAGPLFRELAEDVAGEYPPCLLYTGHPHTAHLSSSHQLTIKAGPEYDRSSILKRLISWLYYFLKALFVVFAHSRQSLLFIVSNPPFLGFAGLLAKLIRKQKYAVLVYDIYPDLLIGLGRLKHGVVSRLWTLLNGLVLERADLVITIGNDMAATLEKSYDLSKTKAGKALVIPNWADMETIKPRNKKDNWFAKQYGLTDKMTVLYSGNMGNAHNIEGVLEAAVQLKDNTKIHFLFIGEGAKWSLVEATIQKYNLSNVTLLPFQPEETLPFSLASGDIGVVAYERGTEGCMLPSKTSYYMAAGLAVLVLCKAETDVSRMVTDYRCGVHIADSNSRPVGDTIVGLWAEPDILREYKNNARKTAEQLYSRRNTMCYIDALKSSVFMK